MEKIVQISVSGQDVWGLVSNGQIARYDHNQGKFIVMGSELAGCVHVVTKEPSARSMAVEAIERQSQPVTVEKINKFPLWPVIVAIVIAAAIAIRLLVSHP